MDAPRSSSGLPWWWDPWVHDTYLYYSPDNEEASILRPCITKKPMSSDFGGGGKVEVPLVNAMTGEEIAIIYLTTDEWSLFHEIQKLSESDSPLRDIIKADLVGRPVFIAVQEHVAGCLKVPSCSLHVVDVSYNGIGVASRDMALTSKLNAPTDICDGGTRIYLPAAPAGKTSQVWSEAFWRVHKIGDQWTWTLSIKITRDRQEVEPPAFVEVKLVSQDKIDGEYPVCAIFTRKIFALRRSHPFGPFDLRRFKDSNLCPNGFTLCLTCWEEKNESIEEEATGIWKRRPDINCDSLLLDA